MAPKSSGSNPASSALARKQKADVARRIQVAAPLSLPANSIDGLPAALDVERFAQARSFEIGAMQSAIKTATAAASHRVWQTLPRHLRRRAASHDVRRVPVRLREKAKLEIDPAKRKKFQKLLKRKRRLASGLGRTESFAKRQRNKTWLETHLWHAKRMHMRDIWGYRLAERPTAKSYRPSHRAAVHGSTLNDISYMATLEVTGKADSIGSILKQCCDLGGVGPWATRYTSGVRACQTQIYEAGMWPRGLIGPAMALWRPESGVDSKATSKSAARSLWIRIHPAMLQDALSSLKVASEQIPEEDRPEISDLSGDINAFELVGPRTNQVIHGALKLADSQPAVKQFWQALANARSPGNFSPGIIIGLTVHDPRLSYPPTNSKVDETHSSSATTLVPPDLKLAQSEIWEQSVRDKLRSPTYKKGQLDRRRSENLVPGTQLRPTANDDKVPLLLIQHTVSHGQASLTASSESSQPLYGWTMMLPPSWSMPFLSSLTHTGTRVVGISARHHQRLETKSLHFPDDYVGCPAYKNMATKQAETERARWERTPKGKRVNYEALGTGSPWASDWDGLVGDRPPTIDTTMADLVPTDRMLDPSPPTSRKPWLFLFPNMSQLIQELAKGQEESVTQTLAAQISAQRTKRGLSVISVDLATELFSTAVVAVHVDMHGRGNPQDRALLYGCRSDDDIVSWRAAVDHNELAMSPLKDHPILGYITSGGFSLQLGRGHGIAIVSLKGLVEMSKRCQGNVLVRVRNLNGVVAPLGSVTPV
ncbi:ribonuclease P [Rhizoctonia solani AG-1 IB]|uniref:Ribonuclease P n=1 Tax=Thanatephorus cucumeris (strain AG1-IB / isolate 7/3/14) TaxID=1108050 RepID=A0A0B7F2K7_THACB|nr:ribonuclease P [Rhizoctonia solani AG-1 IB]